MARAEHDYIREPPDPPDGVAYEEWQSARLLALIFGGRPEDYIISPDNQGATEGTFQPAIHYIPERVKELRGEQPDICWRPSPDWKSVCIKDLAHGGPCGWEDR